MQRANQEVTAPVYFPTIEDYLQLKRHPTLTQEDKNFLVVLQRQLLNCFVSSYNPSQIWVADFISLAVDASEQEYEELINAYFNFIEKSSFLESYHIRGLAYLLNLAPLNGSWFMSSRVSQFFAVVKTKSILTDTANKSALDLYDILTVCLQLFSAFFNTKCTIPENDKKWCLENLKKFADKFEGAEKHVAAELIKVIEQNVLRAVDGDLAFWQQVGIRLFYTGLSVYDASLDGISAAASAVSPTLKNLAELGVAVNISIDAIKQKYAKEVWFYELKQLQNHLIESVVSQDKALFQAFISSFLQFIKCATVANEVKLSVAHGLIDTWMQVLVGCQRRSELGFVRKGCFELFTEMLLVLNDTSFMARFFTESMSVLKHPSFDQSLLSLWGNIITNKKWPSFIHLPKLPMISSAIYRLYTLNSLFGNRIENLDHLLRQHPSYKIIESEISLALEFSYSISAKDSSIIAALYQKIQGRPVFFIVPDEIQGYLNNLKKYYRESKIPYLRSDKRTSVFDAYVHLDIVNNDDGHSVEIRQFFDKAKTHRIVLTGQAGCGKSTCCAYIASAWASQILWHDRFDAIFLISLKKLLVYSNCRTIKEVVKQEYFAYMGQGRFDELWNTLHNQEERVLFLLDGYDELNLEALEKENPTLTFSLKNLLERRNYILTTRPYTLTQEIRRYSDLIFEVRGFGQANIEIYIESFFKENPQLGRELIHFIDENPKLLDVVSTPINLELIVSIWQSDQNPFRRFQYLTMSRLYELMIQFICIRPIVPDPSVIAFIQQLALYLLQEGLILFKVQDIQNACKATLENSKAILQRMLDFGVIRKAIEIDDTFEFIHSTFQEYFAARQLQKIFSFTSDQDKKNQDNTKIFTHRYDPRFEVVWWFLAGMLANEDVKQDIKQKQLARFFHLLLKQPDVDYSCFYQPLLLLRCVGECSQHLQNPLKKEVVGRLIDWIDQVAHLQKSVQQERTFSYVKYTPFLFHEEKFRDRFLRCLHDKDWVKMQAAFRVLACANTQAISEDVIKGLLSAVDDDLKRDLAIKALGTLCLPSNQVDTVIHKLLMQLRHLYNTNNQDSYNTVLIALKKLAVYKASAPYIVTNVLSSVESDKIDYIKQLLQQISLPPIMGVIKPLTNTFRNTHCCEAALMMLKGVNNHATDGEIQRVVDDLLHSLDHAFTTHSGYKHQRIAIITVLKGLARVAASNQKIVPALLRILRETNDGDTKSIVMETFTQLINQSTAQNIMSTLLSDTCLQEEEVNALIPVLLAKLTVTTNIETVSELIVCLHKIKFDEEISVVIKNSLVWAIGNLGILVALVPSEQRDILKQDLGLLANRKLVNSLEENKLTIYATGALTKLYLPLQITKRDVKSQLIAFLEQANPNLQKVVLAVLQASKWEIKLRDPLIQKVIALLKNPCVTLVRKALEALNGLTLHAVEESDVTALLAILRTFNDDTSSRLAIKLVGNLKEQSTPQAAAWLLSKIGYSYSQDALHALQYLYSHSEVMIFAVELLVNKVNETEVSAKNKAKLIKCLYNLSPSIFDKHSEQMIAVYKRLTSTYQDAFPDKNLDEEQQRASFLNKLRASFLNKLIVLSATFYLKSPDQNLCEQILTWLSTDCASSLLPIAKCKAIATVMVRSELQKYKLQQIANIIYKEYQKDRDKFPIEEKTILLNALSRWFLHFDFDNQKQVLATLAESIHLDGMKDCVKDCFGIIDLRQHLGQFIQLLPQFDTDLMGLSIVLKGITLSDIVATCLDLNLDASNSIHQSYVKTMLYKATTVNTAIYIKAHRLCFYEESKLQDYPLIEQQEQELRGLIDAVLREHNCFPYIFYTRPVKFVEPVRTPSPIARILGNSLSKGLSSNQAPSQSSSHSAAVLETDKQALPHNI